MQKTEFWIMCDLERFSEIRSHFMIERTNGLCVHRHLLTNRLHCKAAELCLANG